MPLDSGDSLDAFVVHDFETIQLIGRGSQGVVFKARHRTTGELAVVKTFVGENSAAAGYREAWALYKLGISGPHPNIVGYRSCSACGSHLVLDYVDGVELLEVVQQQNGIRGGALVSLFAQMHAGVRHMHAAGLTHLDLKLENAIFSLSTGRVVWIDFGLSIMHEPDGPDGYLRQPVPFSGSRAYCAPELLAGRATDGFAADVWSLGVCLFAAATTRFPFEEASMNDPRFRAYLKAAEAGRSPLRVLCAGKCHYALSDDAIDLIERMVCPCPERRIGLDEVLTHPWMVANCPAAAPPAAASSRCKRRVACCSFASRSATASRGSCKV